ncbi:class C sortase [Leifsonia sp. F6_8S_P_1B]|uniref:Class C sortase n=1 Tax=Leifsonia williamsii TaxID=3035919 RepID=A0ABT8KD23_9MICO|nr:class C sortase [Leifsonia williamsii]MDN4615364.1 class C sortase [Leifsonia williamsii]
MRATIVRPQGLLIRLLLLLGVAIGLGLILYPAAATWFSDRAHAAQLQSYATTAAGLGEARTNALLREAASYNEHLPYGQLRDPYSTTAPGTPATSASTAYAAYAGQLTVAGNQVMSRITVPAIGLSLPIFHGTSTQTLDKGVGHLFGSSLPVGGPGTHAVLTAHSGLVDATMFTDLHELRRGDTFIVTTLGRALTYRVDRIDIVKPDDISLLRIVPGEDHVTLVTCTPIHVNSHRLLVRGTRVPDSPETARRVAAATAPDAGFPWWLLLLLAPLAASAVFLLLPQRRTPASTLRTPAGSAEPPGVLEQAAFPAALVDTAPTPVQPASLRV